MKLLLSIGLIVGWLVGPSSFAVAASLLLNESEISAALSHGPWPLDAKFDPSNRVSGNPEAIAFGERLFFSPELSENGKISCATCHQPKLDFTDGLPRALGTKQLDRNTQGLFNLRHQRWFGWGGGSDNLWAQSLLPVVHVNEMAMSRDGLSATLSLQPFVSAYGELFGSPSEHSDEENLVNVGKALAAYVETLETGRSEFDRFRDALAVQNWDRAATFPEAAQRGFQLFSGKGKCSFCHTGPLFSNGEFHDAGVPYFVEPGRVDSGRHDGIKSIKTSPFTLDGNYSDDAEKTGAWALRQVKEKHADFGTFRVPSLRNVANTAPYMHNGSLLTLDAVALHYSNIDLERLHADGELILEPLNLTTIERSDLVEFLQSLTAPLVGLP